MLRVSLQAAFYMIWKDQVFIIDVVVMDMTQKTVANLNVISWLVGATMKLSASIEGFMRGTTLFRWPWRCTSHLGMIWIVSPGNAFMFFTINNWEVIYFITFDFEVMH
jgi:hypothetical protein